ncbi:MAG: 30S ribosomal protein S4 [Candidatus Liptonbacteria bacterium]|nr:30S ribosomal protein S4 [Candidatus Liptonbacteria bacterium]
MIKVKEKKERALGERLQLKGERCNSPKCAAVRKPYRPGIHGPKKRLKTVSEFGRQLAEKQKFKITYRLKEKNLRRLFGEADKKAGSTADKLLELMERRLDNVVYHLGLAGSSRGLARQLILHGHFLVNQKRVRSPGFQVKTNDLIAFREESKKLKNLSDLRNNLKKYEPPSWLFLDKEKLEGRVLSLPENQSSPFEINLLVESFSK